MNTSPISPIATHYHSNPENKKNPKKPNLRYKMLLTLETLATTASVMQDISMRYCGKRSVKEVRVKVESPQRSLERERGCKGGRVWLLDTNHL